MANIINSDVPLKTGAFSRSVADKLKSYVYIYLHPETNEVFYVGKGKGNRVFHHLADTTECDKVTYIEKLKKANLKPKIEILVHGLDDLDAERVETAIIDLLGTDKLTNSRRGAKSATYGRMSIEQVNSTYQQQSVDISEPCVLIRISKAFHYSMTHIELYDYTRGQWRVNRKTAEKAKYAFSVYQGVVQEVYEIAGWFDAGTTFSTNTGLGDELEEISKQKPTKRLEFVGKVASDDIRDKYRYKSVGHYFKQGNSNPIRFLNIR